MARERAERARARAFIFDSGGEAVGFVVCRVIWEIGCRRVVGCLDRYLFALIMLSVCLKVHSVSVIDLIY